MFSNDFTWLGLVILLVIGGCYFGLSKVGKKVGFGVWMLVALGMGLVLGAAVQLIFGTQAESVDTAFAFEIANIARTAYGNLLKLMVMPLVMVAIMSGIIKAGESGGEGKSIGKAMGITIATLLITCAISALVAVATTAIWGLSSAGLVGKPAASTATTLTDTINSIFAGTNVLAVLSGSSILPIIFLAVLFGVIILGLKKESPEAAAKLTSAIDVVFEFVMGLVDIVIGLAPYGVFAYILNFAANTSFSQYLVLGEFVIASYVAMILMFAIHLVIIVVMCQVSPQRFFRNAGKALMIAFSTRSSMATLPVTIENMEDIGVEPAIATFAGTFGTCVGQNGCGGVYPAMLATMVYTAQGTNLLTSPVELVVLIVIITICSLGIAGVGGGATAAGLMVFGILGFDVSLIAVLFSVEALIDMGRTFLNVSDAFVAGIVGAKFSGQLSEEGAHKKTAATAA